MKKLTPQQLRQLPFQHVFSELSETPTIEPAEFEIIDLGDTTTEMEKSPAVSSAWGYSEFAADDVKIFFDWAAEGNTNGSFSDLYDFTVNLATDQPVYPIQIEGAILVDEDGDPLDRADAYEELRKFANEFYWECGPSSILPEEPAAEDIDTDKETDMEEITVARDNDRDLRFKGEKIAWASSSPNNAHSNYSRNTGRWTELNLYKTAGGKFVCEQIGRTQWQGEHDRRSALVCDTTDEVMNFFGAGWLAKELYEEAGIECVETIE